MSRRTLGQLGERAAISALSAIFGKACNGKNVILGVNDNDDTALLDVGGKGLATTTDTMTAATHMPEGASYRQFGWYAAAANLSDLASKGAKPIGMLFAFGIPNDFLIDDLMSVARGISSCGSKYRAPIVGGDTKWNREFTIAGMALGIIEEKEFMPRKAHLLVEGDAVFVTGAVGRAAYAQYAFDSGAISAKERAKLMMEVEPRINEGRALARSGAVRASMDLSDSLAESLGTLARMNSCEIIVNEDAIPLYGKKKGENHFSTQRLISYGGDFELLFIVDGKKVNRIRNLAKGKSKFTQIGCISSVGNKHAKVIIERGRTSSVLEPESFRHFSNIKCGI